MKKLFFILALCFLPAAAADSHRGKLDLCVYLYENGKYAEAIDSLKALIPRVSDKKELAECYKYLGFSSVMLDMINNAKVNFGKMLEEYPNMEIDTIQVPPNITIVFKQVVTEKELEVKKQKEAELTQTLEQGNRKRSLIAAGAAGAVGITGASLGGIFLSKENRAYRRYQASRIPSEISGFRDDAKSDLLWARVCFGISGTAILFSGYKFFTLPAAEKRISLGYDDGKLTVCLKF